MSTPLTLYQQFNGKYGYIVIGNTHNAFDNMQNPSPPCQMSTSSSATLNLNPNQTIEGAYLIWSGIGDGVGTNITLNGNLYTPDVLNSGYAQLPSFYYFSSVKDITSYVQNYGSGNYQITNFDLNPIINLYCSNNLYYSGWNIVVVYSDYSLPNVQLNIYDGLQILFNFANSSVSFPINNLNVTNISNASLTCLSWNGSPIFFLNESFSINGDTLGNMQNPVNNPFNGTDSFTGSNSSWNRDADQFDISNFINIGDTSANIEISSPVLRLISNIITSIPSELPEATITFDSITGQDLCDNRTLAVDFTVFNVNANDTLPANTPVSFFVNDSVFVSTVTTPSEILIGDSLTMSASVTIPPGIASPFDLTVIANQDSTTLGVFQESNLTNNTADTTLSLTELIVPTFDSIAPVCQGTSVILPSSSTNGIAGTWSPSFDNQQTTTYTFTPSAGLCADTVDLTVQVVPQTLPTFSLPDSICVGGNVVFPIVSSNGVSGTWSPGFDNQNTTTYTFTPDSTNVAAGCPISTSHTVVVVPITTPSFSFTDSLCINENLVLPTGSDNGVLGAWSPGFDNQNTTTYTFNSDTFSVLNGCAASVNQTVEIIPNIVPSFSVVDSLCADAVFTLPTSSQEGVLGSWSPAFDNQNTQNYTFTPTSDSIVTTTQGPACPLPTSTTLAIVPRTNPIFSLPDTICVGAVLDLPVTSDNGFSGTWSPATNNQATTTYTFTPSLVEVSNNCPASVQETVIVDPFVDPVFTPIDSICQGNTLSLPTLSENGINGTWSPAENNQATTTYTFTPTDPGCISSAQMTVPVFPLVTPTFSLPDSLCQNDSISFPTVSNNGISGTWSPAFDSQNTTTYTFTPDSNECAVVVQHTIEVAPRVTPSFLSLTDTLCAGSNLNFPTVSDNNISGLWSPALNNQQTTTYTFTRDSNECATSIDFTLTVLPLAVTFDTISRCANDLPFVWNGQSLSSTTNTSATLQDQYGCDSTANLYFEVLPVKTSSFSAEICANQPPFVWAGQSYDQTGTYQRVFTAENGCDSTVTFDLTVNPAPQVSLSVQPWSGCLPLEIEVVNDASAHNNTNSSTYLWDFGNGQTATTASQATGLYAQDGCYDIELTITNEFGCIETQQLLEAVCIDPNPVAAFLPQNNPLPLVDPTTLLENNSTSASTFVWDFGDGIQNNTQFSPQHTYPEQAGSYLTTLTIENENGCQDSTSEFITIEQNPLFYVPNAFTPDGNGTNETFQPIFADNLVLSEFSFKIYNRWGEILFESKDPATGWDGTYGGKIVQDGTYVYTLEFQESGFEKTFNESGSVNLLK